MKLKHYCATALFFANAGLLQAAVAGENEVGTIQVGVRPQYLINRMDAGELKDKLLSCINNTPKKTDFSIGHRGAALQFPEHTKESYIAAAKMGAGIVECDVTFTKDKQLVCRHAQNDLHTTTNILVTPLASKCTKPFTPADPATGKEATAECRTSDITLAEFKTLKGKMDAYNPNAKTPEEYIGGTPSWRTDLYTTGGTLMTHKESIELFKQLGIKMTPELKTPIVDMPYEGNYTQADYASQMINDYIEAGVSPDRVYPQSFSLDDILLWAKKYPDFAKQAVFLDNSQITVVNSSVAYMKSLYDRGVRILGPVLWKMMTLDADKKIVASDYAKNAKAANLKMIAWTLESSGLLKDHGGEDYITIAESINKDSDMYTVLDVLAKQVGIIGMFSDWPATVTYYANCMGL